MSSIIERNPRLTYAIPIISVILLSLLIDPLSIQRETPRYMLSALIQSEAAIVAIVITLSLVAVQLTASSYSSRVIGIFRNSPDFWGLLVLYLFAISLSSYILEIIEVGYTPNLEISIRMCFLLGVFCFSALIPYTYIMLTMLSPSTIIGKLSRRIDEENILEADDPIQPIIDIVLGSMMRYDFETTKDGVGAVGEKICTLLKLGEYEKEEEKRISKRIFGHFSRISKIAAAREDEHSILVIIENIENISKAAAANNFKEILKSILTLINEIGRTAVERRFEEGAARAVESQGMIVKKLVEEEEYLDRLMVTIGNINEMGKIALKKSLREVLVQEIVFFERILETIKKKESAAEIKKPIMIIIKNSLEDLEKMTENVAYDMSQWCSAILSANFNSN